MIDFTIAWLASAGALLGLAAWAGKTATGNWVGVLIDIRGRYSLTHFQTVTWSLMVLSTFLAVMFSSSFDVSKLKIDASILQLMGISAGSAVLVAGVKSMKDAPGSASGPIARVGESVTRLDNSKEPVTAKFGQIWLEEEGPFADKVVNITKFQGFVFTLVALVVFASLAFSARGLPTLPDNFTWLLGISHAGYVVGKVPDKPQKKTETP